MRDDDLADSSTNVPVRPRRSSRHRRPGEELVEASIERTIRNQLARLGLTLHRDRWKRRTQSHQGGWMITGRLTYGQNYELSLDEVAYAASFLLQKRIAPEIAMRQLFLDEQRRRTFEKLREVSREVLDIGAKIKNAR
jgi:hypothetical protein